MRRISAIFVPRLLSDDQKAVRVCICRKLKQQARVDPSFIPNIITGFKLWVFGYEPETKQQGSQWMSSNSTRPKKERQVRRNVKSVLIVFTISKALSTSNSYPLVKLSMANFTVWMWSGWGRAFGLNVQTSGRKQLIYPTRQRARLHIIRCSKIPDVQKHYSGSLPPIRLTSPPATFSYSPRWNYGWKGVVSTRLSWSTQKRKRLSTHSHLRTSRGAWNLGKHTGIAVYMPKGTTSKETVETGSYGKKLFMANFPELWVAPRICPSALQ